MPIVNETISIAVSSMCLQICLIVTRPLSVIDPAWADALLCTQSYRAMTHSINYSFFKGYQGIIKSLVSSVSMYTGGFVYNVSARENGPLRPCLYKQVFVRGCGGLGGGVDLLHTGLV